MTQPVNLLARDDFKKGEEGYVLGEGVRLGDGVRKLMGPGMPQGAVLVTAIEAIKAGTHGHFQEAIRPRRPVAPIPQMELEPKHERRVTLDRRVNRRGGRRSTDRDT